MFRYRWMRYILCHIYQQCCVQGLANGQAASLSQRNLEERDRRHSRATGKCTPSRAEVCCMLTVTRSSERLCLPHNPIYLIPSSGHNFGTPHCSKPDLYPTCITPSSVILHRITTRIMREVHRRPLVLGIKKCVQFSVELLLCFLWSLRPRPLPFSASAMPCVRFAYTVSQRRSPTTRPSR